MRYINGISYVIIDVELSDELSHFVGRNGNRTLGGWKSPTTQGGLLGGKPP